MKKTIVAAALLFASVATFAQKQGDFFVEGTLGLSAGSVSTTVKSGNNSNTVKSSLGTNFNLYAGAGYFVMDNLKVGADLGYVLSNEGDTKTPVFAISPNVAYYVQLANNFYYVPSFNLNVLFGSQTTSTNILGTTVSKSYSYTGFGANLTFLGFEYRFNKSIALGVDVANLYYNAVKIKDKDDKTQSTTTGVFGVDFGSASVALRFYF